MSCFIQSLIISQRYAIKNFFIILYFIFLHDFISAHCVISVINFKDI